MNITIFTAKKLRFLTVQPMRKSSGQSLVHTSFILLRYTGICYITIPNMFRAVPCLSSGGQIVLLHPLVSSLSVNSRRVRRWRVDCIPLIFRRTNCIITSSGIVTLCKQPYSMPVEVLIETR